MSSNCSTCVYLVALGELKSTRSLVAPSTSLCPACGGCVHPWCVSTPPAGGVPTCRPCSEKEPSVTEGNGGLGTHAGDQCASRHQGSQDSGVEGPGYQGAATHPTASVDLTSPDKSTGSCAPPMEGGPCDKSSPGSRTPGVGTSPQGETNSVLESETKPAAMGCTQGPGKMPPASLGEDVPVASRLAAVGSMESDVPLQQESVPTGEEKVSRLLQRFAC
ncbi:unnamed protein product, partial [Ascophyllum nodosum]